MPRIGNLLAGDRPMRKVKLPKATEGPAEGRWCRGRHPRLLRATPGSAVDGSFEWNKNGGVGISTSKQTPCRRIRMSHHDAQARGVPTSWSPMIQGRLMTSRTLSAVVSISPVLGIRSARGYRPSSFNHSRSRMN